MSAIREPADQRRRELARIHLRAKELGLDGDAYRDTLFAVTRKRSAAELDAGERKRVLDHLGAGRARYPGRPKFTTREAQIEKIEALLTVDKRPWSYAKNMAKHMYRKDALEFCSEKELRGLITALVKDRERRLRREEVNSGI